jgi:hypothetical protein
MPGPKGKRKNAKLVICTTSSWPNWNRKAPPGSSTLTLMPSTSRPATVLRKQVHPTSRISKNPHPLKTLPSVVSASRQRLPSAKLDMYRWTTMGAKSLSMTTTSWFAPVSQLESSPFQTGQTNWESYTVPKTKPELLLTATSQPASTQCPKATQELVRTQGRRTDVVRTLEERTNQTRIQTKPG